MSNHISIIQGATKTLAIDLVDETGEPIALTRLVGASAEFLLREQPDDVTNVLRFTTADNPTNLVFETLDSVLDLSFAPTDTSGLTLGLYFYQVQIALVDGSIYDAIPWNLFDLNLGGSAPVPPAPFDNTVMVNHDYPMSDDMTYKTPGGSPIENAQVRVYLKSDYDVKKLDAPVGVTTTNAGGKWVQPILVTPGYSYVARFEVPYGWGPDEKAFDA